MASSLESSNGSGLPRAGGVSFCAITIRAVVANTMPIRNPAGVHSEVPQRRSNQAPISPGPTIMMTTATVRENQVIAWSKVRVAFRGVVL